MARPALRRRHTDLQLESVARISRFPIVESSIVIAGNVYEKIKRSNSLMGWSLDTAEQSLALATATALPAVIAFNMPIMTLDHLLCKGIDIFEQNVPAVHLPPHLMYWNTREYVNNKFVKPVLIRADSVKQIGSQAANAAVDRLAGAIDAADQYVDRYLPPDPADKIAETCTDSGKPEDKCSDGVSGSKAARTIEHGARFSRKLQRRLTRRTLAEARALKEQGTECIHVLLYVAELIATDPKLAMEKAKELWSTLSLPEPENQARPTNLEQLLVMCTREAARRLVHLVNGAASLASRAPRRLASVLLELSHRLRALSEQVLQVILLEQATLPCPDSSLSCLPSRPAARQQLLPASTDKLLLVKLDAFCAYSDTTRRLGLSANVRASLTEPDDAPGSTLVLFAYPCLRTSWSVSDWASSGLRARRLKLEIACALPAAGTSTYRSIAQKRASPVAELDRPWEAQAQVMLLAEV